jgi:putative membrane protein
MYYHDHMNGWGWFAWSTSMILLWAILIIGIVVLVRYLDGTKRPSPPSTPEQVLAERFARGEIDEAEYEQRLAVLRGKTRL